MVSCYVLINWVLIKQDLLAIAAGNYCSLQISSVDLYSMVLQSLDNQGRRMAITIIFTDTDNSIIGNYFFNKFLAGGSIASMVADFQDMGFETGPVFFYHFFLIRYFGITGKEERLIQEIHLYHC